MTIQLVFHDGRLKSRLRFECVYGLELIEDPNFSVANNFLPSWWPLSFDAWRRSDVHHSSISPVEPSRTCTQYNPHK